MLKNECLNMKKKVGRKISIKWYKIVVNFLIKIISIDTYISWTPTNDSVWQLQTLYASVVVYVTIQKTYNFPPFFYSNLPG